MKLSLQMTMIIAAVFAIICFGIAITGFGSLGDITDPAQAADARGFAWFWTFLAGVAVAFGLLAWWMKHTSKDDEG